MTARATDRGHGGRGALATVAVMLLALVSCANGTDVTAAPDADADGPDPISVEMLTSRAAFSDDVGVRFSYTLEGLDGAELDIPDASHVATARITVQPGAAFPWHTHPGPVLVNVAEGALVYILADDCVERRYDAGQAFVDPGGNNTHTAYNPTDEETILVATFFDSPASPDEPLTVPVSPSQQEALNEQCDR